MTAGPWNDRLERVARLFRAPLNFARFQSYRAAVFRGLAFGEALASGRADPRSFDEAANLHRGQSRIDIAWRRLPAAINVVVPADDVTASGQAPALALACNLVRLGGQVRLLVVDAPTARIERSLRRRLEDAFGLPASAQARLEIADAASRTAACGPLDLFVAPDPRCAAMTRAALAEAARENALRMSGPDGASPEDLVAELAARRGIEDGPADPADAYGQVSARGLRRRVLLPPPEDLSGRRVCLFVHFDPDRRIDPHVQRYMAALKACGLDLLLVSSCALDEAALEPVRPLLIGAVCRENVGLDFSGWALAIEMFPQLGGCEALVIANDSVYGPVGDLQPMIDRMEAGAHAVWGATRNYDIAEHIQSWFVWFRAEALRSEAFRRFWSDVLPLSDKQAIIETYEIPLQRAFERAGFAVGAAVDLMMLQVANGNPTMHPWRRLLDQGCPFVKVQLLRDDPVRSDLESWTETLSARGYPVGLILDHLARTAPHAAAFNRR